MNLSIVCWNINGLLSKIADVDFMQYMGKFDICCLVETFTYATLDLTSCFGEYLVMHSPGVKLSTQGRLSGGVVVLIKKGIGGKIERLCATGDSTIAFKIQSSNFQNTIVICTYIPPFDSPYYSDKDVSKWSLIEDLILNFQEKYPQAVILLCGDLNARIGKWDLHTDDEEIMTVDNTLGMSCVCNTYNPRQSQDDKTNSFGKILKSLCKIHHITLLNGCTEGDKTGQFTYISPLGNSVIDYGLVVAQHLPYKIDLTVGSRIESDHMPIEISIGSPVEPTSTQEILTYTKITWTQSKTEEFQNQIRSERFHQQLKSTCRAIDTSCNLALSIFNSALIQCAECMRREVKIRGKPVSQTYSAWFDKECRVHKQLAKKALRQYKKGKQDEQKTNYLQARNLYKSIIREKKKSYFAEIQRSLTYNARDSHTFWSIIRNASQRKAIEANIDINKWKQHFVNLLQNREANTNNTFNTRDVKHNDILDSPISPAEVRMAIHNLKASKAPGLDGIPGGCIKAAGETIVPLLTELFNAIFDLHDFPEIWSHSVIVPIHKKGSTSITDNYRGISLLSALGKVFTAILSKRLRSWMESENKVCTEQAGFRANCSTVDHIFTLHTIISKHVYGDGRGKLFVAFIDYHKAFDSVDRERLWEILHEAGVSTKFLLTLQSMY